ncbi:MAG TPA: molybdate ABC transporter substrate-binding protein [Natronosporangium sp.]
MTGFLTVPARIAVGLAVALAVVGCGGDDEPAGDASPGALSGDLTVFAAASLTEAFTQIGEEFGAANPGVAVTFNFAGSSTLAQQINEGAPADVFASANPANMQTVTDAGNAAGEPTTFARNQLVIAVAAGNPLGITGLADLADPDVKVALCAEQVPCGAAAQTALAAAGVELTPVTLEQDVRAALSKLTLGEVDAALVYRTDVAAVGSAVAGIDFPEAASAVNDYPIVVLADAPNPQAAAAFVAYVLASAGQAVLAQAGFQTL